MIPFALPRTFGKLLGDKRQGFAILATMAVIFTASLALITTFEAHHSGSALTAAGAAMEGKEVRFGVPSSALFANATTLTSTGAVNSMHDSFTPLAGGTEMLNMMYGEIAPGGTGSGLYGMLVLAVITVFVAGLMVGRTPEYLGKKIRAREVKFAALYILTTPAVVLIGTGVCDVDPVGPGVHGERRPARSVRGALRLHLAGQQQRQRLRRSDGQHELLQHRAAGWPC